MKPLKPTLLIGLTALLFTALSCSKNDNEVPEPENRTPECFDLATVANGAQKVDPRPEFSWNTAADPDGNAVSYTLFVDTLANPEAEMASGLTATSFTSDGRLPLNKKVYWKVLATDGNNESVSSEIYSFTTRSLNKAKQTTASAQFSPRTKATAVAFVAHGLTKRS